MQNTNYAAKKSLVSKWLSKGAEKLINTLKEESILSESVMIPDNTLSQALDRYGKEVSPKKRGCKWERFRLNKMHSYIGHLRLRELRSHHIASYRDTRLTEVSPNSVSRDLNLLSHVFTICVKEWGWLRENPCVGIRRPPKPPHRERRVLPNEENAIVAHLGYSDDVVPLARKHQVCAAFLLALETAMRLGEIESLTWVNVDFESRVATLPMTKNGRKREVPLSNRAIAILRNLKRATGNTPKVLNLKKGAISAVFVDTKKALCIQDLHFHDTRHEAITRLAKKIHILDLARMVGHRDVRMLQIYYNASASDIAKLLD